MKKPLPSVLRLKIRSNPFGAFYCKTAFFVTLLSTFTIAAAPFLRSEIPTTMTTYIDFGDEAKVTFSEAVAVGQYATGDYFVVNPADGSIALALVG